MARFLCPACDYVYDEAVGAPREGWPAGTPFAEIDEDWPCPDCGVRDRQDFEPVVGMRG
jgi:rubredoxin